MGTPIIPAGQPHVEPTAAAQPSSANPTTAGAAAQSNAPTSYTSSTKISSLEDLKKKAPKVYDAMLKGICMGVIRDMREHQEHLKEMMRKGREGKG